MDLYRTRIWQLHFQMQIIQEKSRTLIKKRWDTSICSQVHFLPSSVGIGAGGGESDTKGFFIIK